MAGETPLQAIAGQFGRESGNRLLPNQGIPPERHVSADVLRNLKTILEDKNRTQPWDESLFQVVEHIPEQSGNVIRAQEQFSAHSMKKELDQGKADGTITPEHAQRAEDRLKQIQDAPDLLNKMDRFSSLSKGPKGEQAALVKTLLEPYKRTPFGAALVAEGNNDAAIQKVLNDLLTKGMHQEDRSALQNAVKQWAESVQKDLNPLHEQIQTTREGIKQLDGKIATSKRKITEHENNRDKKKDKLKKYENTGNDEFDDLTKYGGLKEKENVHTIATYAKKMGGIDNEINSLQTIEKRLMDAQTSGNKDALSKVLGVLVARFVNLGAIPADDPTFFVKSIESIDSRIAELSSNKTELQSKYDTAQIEHARYEELKKKKSSLKDEIKDFEKKKETEENNQTELEAQLAKNKAHITELVKQFDLFEDGLTDAIANQLIEETLQRYNARYGPEAKNNYDAAFTLTSEERKMKIRRYFNDKFLDISGAPGERVRKGVGKIISYTGFPIDVILGKHLGHKTGDIRHWIANRVGGQTLTIRTRNDVINNFYNNVVLNPGVKQENIDRELKTALKIKNEDWIAVSEQEKMQMRSMVVLEAIAMRQNALGKMPTLLEQRLLVSQPWSTELIKANVIGNPDFADEIREKVPGVNPEDVAKGDQAAISKVREATTNNPVMGAVLLGLTAASAMSAFNKNEQQHA